MSAIAYRRYRSRRHTATDTLLLHAMPLIDAVDVIFDIAAFFFIAIFRHADAAYGCHRLLPSPSQISPMLFMLMPTRRYACRYYAYFMLDDVVTTFSPLRLTPLSRHNTMAPCLLFLRCYDTRCYKERC